MFEVSPQPADLGRVRLAVTDLDGSLLLDDSTSALDLRTESAFYRTLDDYTEALHREGHSLTKIIVAQRIATARRADRIAVLDGGRLVACGSHESLLASCPVYQEICASQLRAKSGKGE